MMKRTALASTCILLLISLATGIEMVNLAEVNAQENQPQIMSFEEAIEAVNTEIYDGPLIIFLMNGGESVEPQGGFLVDNSGVSGLLMWLASDGTFYESEYPSGMVMEEIGHTVDQDDWVWNATDPCYIWYLHFPSGTENMGKYWLFANNGTMIFYLHEIERHGPVPTPFPTEVKYGLVVAFCVVIGGILIFGFLKMKSKGIS